MSFFESPSKLFDSDLFRWAALQTRNPLATSAFVYCVTTTSICCRPTCKARLARRSNIIFHNTYGDAAAAGFRACKRCKPELQNEHDPQLYVVGQACRAIEDAEAEVATVKLEDLARGARLTKSHFHRVFKKVMGVTPKAYAQNVRARKMLDQFVNVSSAADTPEMDENGTSVENSDGFKTPDELCLMSGDTFAPVHYKQGGDDADLLIEHTDMHHYVATKYIEYTIQPWSAGFVLIAARKDGICWLEAGNSEIELCSTLAHQFPTANLGLSDWLKSAGPGQTQNEYYGMFEDVMEALVRPTGRTMDFSFNIS